ncbi:MAG: hypothetical protein ACREEL_11095 [Stellaceae bacterium]
MIRLPRRAGQRQSELSAAPAPTISDYELHAFVDGALDPARRERVQAFLVRHPAAAADAAAYRHQNHVLRELRRERRSLSPALGYLSAQLARRLALLRGGRALTWGVAAAVVAAVAWSVVSGDWAAMPYAVLAASR